MEGISRFLIIFIFLMVEALRGGGQITTNNKVIFIPTWSGAVEASYISQGKDPCLIQGYTDLVGGGPYCFAPGPKGVGIPRAGCAHPWHWFPTPFSKSMENIKVMIIYFETNIQDF